MHIITFMPSTSTHSVKFHTHLRLHITNKKKEIWHPNTHQQCNYSALTSYKFTLRCHILTFERGSRDRKLEKFVRTRVVLELKLIIIIS